MKNLLLSLFFLISTYSAFAQPRVLAEGIVFDEPRNSAIKIVQLRSGGTFFLNSVGDSKINVRLYSKDHGEIFSGPIELGDRKINGTVERIFEIDGDVVLIIFGQRDNKTLMFRLILDGNTGKVKDKSFEIENVFPASIDTRWANVYCKKDPFSQTYALMTIVPHKSGIIATATVLGSNHEIVYTTQFNFSKEKFRYIEYLDFSITSPTRISLFMRGHQSNKRVAEENFVWMLQMEKKFRTSDC